MCWRWLPIRGYVTDVKSQYKEFLDARIKTYGNFGTHRADPVCADCDFAPWLAPYSPDKVIGMAWQAPDATLRLGTDNLGRDLLSRMIWGPGSRWV